MNKQRIHILVLLCCALFWICNMVWIVFDNPDLFFKPLAILLAALMYMAKEYSKNQSRKIYHLTWFFYMLSLANVVDELILDPVKVVISDYLTALFILFITIYRINRERKNLGGNM